MFYVIPFNNATSDYGYQDNLFSDEEIETLKEYMVGEPEKATIGALEVDEDYRRTDVWWLHLNHMSDIFYERIGAAVADINSKFFNYDITQFQEPIQLCLYREENKGTYDWHTDGRVGVSRKLSITVQLSSPDEYEGGEVLLKTGKENQILPKEKGTAIVFPSHTLHKVQPVTKGKRYSLVAWITGPALR